MNSIGRRVAVVAGASMLVLLLAWAALHAWLDSDDLRDRAQARIAEALGVGVRLGGIEMDVWPVPAVALRQVELLTEPVLRIERLELRLVLRALVRREVQVHTAVVRHAALSQRGVAQWLDAMSRVPAPPDTAVAAFGLPEHVVVDGLRWQPAEGQGLLVDADLRLDTQGLPEEGRLQVREGWMQGTAMVLSREAAAAGQEHRWRLVAQVAGGSAQGGLAITHLPTQGTPLRMEGSVETRGVDLAALARAMGRDAPLHGRLEASTRWHLQASGWGDVVAGLRSQSHFRVEQGVLQGLDLVRAVRTVGMNRGGETRLDLLTGELSSRGRILQFRQLEARSGILHATGKVDVSARRSLEGRVVVSLTPAALSPVLGVPLEVGGTLDAPTATLTRSAMVGAAIGTAVLPGVGTGAGASLGGRVGDAVQGLFGR